MNKIISIIYFTTISCALTHAMQPAQWIRNTADSEQATQELQTLMSNLWSNPATKPQNAQAKNALLLQVEALLKRNANPNISFNIKGADNTYPLIKYALDLQIPELVRTLIKTGHANDTYVLDQLVTELFRRTSINREQIDFLLNTGVNLNKKSHLSIIGPVLTDAIFYRLDLSIIQKILDAGANPNIQLDNGITPLMLAVDNNNTNIVRLLLQRRADPNIKNNAEDTALIRAVKNSQRSPEIIRLLITHGANANIQNKKGESAISIAREQAELPLLRLFGHQ